MEDVFDSLEEALEKLLLLELKGILLEDVFLVVVPLVKLDKLNKWMPRLLLGDYMYSFLMASVLVSVGFVLLLLLLLELLLLMLLLLLLLLLLFK